MPGKDLFKDIRGHLPNFNPDVVFDIGAHRGESARAFMEHFSKTSVYCFEPAPKNFQDLKLAVLDPKRVTLIPMAFGAKRGTGALFIPAEASTMASFHPLSMDDVCVMVDIDTVDHVAAAFNVKHIDYLKIDTEGWDLHVLEGAAAMLAGNKIGLIQVEAGMNPSNQWHRPFKEFVDFLEPKGYFLFGIYEQTHEWPTHTPCLRRSDLVFISKPTRELNRYA